jgi:hypothetical protein
MGKNLIQTGEHKMNEAKWLTLVGILGLAVILAAGFPLSRVKADHCHTAQSQTPPANVQPPARPAAPSAEQPRAARRIATTIPSPQNTRVKSEPSNAGTAPASAATASIEQIYSRDLPLAIQSIGQAVKAIESGDKQTELAELTKAVNMLATIREALGKHVKPQLANSRCPIMGSAINPDSVTANLTRDYKDQKIGFCCGGCPSAWDKLTDAEKQAKLSSVKS